MDHELAIGTVIDGRFTLRRLLGGGGFGTVWVAFDAFMPDREVALKILHRSHRRDPRVIGRFTREVEILLELDHPNIVRALSYGMSGEEIYLAYVFAPGLPLSIEIEQRIDGGRSFSLGEIGNIFRGVSDALSYAHGKRVIHRDLKPSNVIVRTEGGIIEIKVLDFGLAKIANDAADRVTTEGWVLGSTMYLAPEQKTGKGVDERTDIFCLGSMLFELLTLRRAWARDTRGEPMLSRRGPPADKINAPVAVMQRITSAPRPLASTFRPGIPSALDEIVARAMAIDPRDRFSSVSAFAAELENALRGGTPSEVETSVLETHTLEPPTLQGNTLEDLAKFAIMLEEPPTWGTSSFRLDAPPTGVPEGRGVQVETVRREETKVPRMEVGDVIAEAVRDFQERRADTQGVLPGDPAHEDVDASSTLRPVPPPVRLRSKRRFELLTVITWTLVVLVLTTLFFLVSRARFVRTRAVTRVGVERATPPISTGLSQVEVESVAPSRAARLREILEEVRRRPEDAKLLGRLGRQVLHAAAKMPEGSVAARRHAALGAVLGDAALLDACIGSISREERDRTE